MSEKQPISKEFWGKDNPIRQRFTPILPFSVPYMVFPMEDFVERSEKLQEILSERLNLQSYTNSDTPTDFFNQDEDYVRWKTSIFNDFFAKEIELISKAWFDWMVETKESSAGRILDYPYIGEDSTYNPDEHGLIVTSAWIEQAQTFHQHLPHDHGHETFSCVFYAGFDETSHDAATLVSPYKSPDGMVYQYLPNIKEGDILVIPGNILHYTTQNRSVKPRTVIVFNLVFKQYIKGFADPLQQ